MGIVYSEPMEPGEWQRVKQVADIRLWFAPGCLQSPNGVMPGRFDAETETFSLLHDVADYGADSSQMAERGSSFLTTSVNASGLWAEPRVGGTFVLWGSHKTSLDELHGRTITHFVRTLTGFGYDSVAQQVGIRGRWEIYGH